MFIPGCILDVPDRARKQRNEISRTRNNSKYRPTVIENNQNRTVSREHSGSFAFIADLFTSDIWIYQDLDSWILALDFDPGFWIRTRTCFFILHGPLTTLALLEPRLLPRITTFLSRLIYWDNQQASLKPGDMEAAALSTLTQFN